MDAIEKALRAYTWPFADQDLAGLDQVKKRIARTGRERSLITYSDLVAGIDFIIPTVNGGRSLRLGVPDWSELHRAIVGDFLGRVCVDTYAAGKFLGSALVVSADTMQPSAGYRRLASDLGFPDISTPEAFMNHWILQVQTAYEWFGR